MKLIKFLNFFCLFLPNANFNNLFINDALCCIVDLLIASYYYYFILKYNIQHKYMKQTLMRQMI